MPSFFIKRCACQEVGNSGMDRIANYRKIIQKILEGVCWYSKSRDLNMGK